jgi:nicotinamide-nucleotide amidase
MAQHVGDIQTRLGSALGSSDVSIAVAESLTGGELAARFAVTPGSAAWFRGGIVAYGSGVKHDLLDVPPGPVVSEAAAVAMAQRVCDLMNADLAVAVTGVAGPDDQDGEAPGTVWLALRHDGRTEARRLSLSGDPAEVVDATCERALRWVTERIESSSEG